jgi:glycosyltransferase involved in cell wall biosynthesis
MKCIFLFSNAPLSPNFSGAGSRSLNSFAALCKLGVDVHVWRFLSENTREQVLAHEKKESESNARSHSQAAEWSDIPYTPVPLYSSRSELLYRALLHPIDLTFCEAVLLREKFLRKVKEVNPDFIWAEGGSAAALVAGSRIALPWVYAHFDMYFRILKLRQKAQKRTPHLSEQIRMWALQRGETYIIRSASTLITGSQTEAEALRALGSRNVYLIPTMYEPATINMSLERRPTSPRIFHLGSLRTTANYLGLMAYLEKVQPRLDSLCNESSGELLRLHIIGDTAGAKPELLDRLKKHGAHFYGHVDDLKTILHPFDIVIIPYEHDTGTRTKLPLMFNYAQVVVTTQAAVAGSPEVRQGKNCIVLPNVESFTDVLSNLVHDNERRVKIGLSARQTFDSEFTIDSQLQKFSQALHHL